MSGPLSDGSPGTESVLLVGSFLSAHRGSYGVAEGLADRLEEAGWTVYSTSTRQRPLARILDMVATAWIRRRDYRVAHVDVYSGRAFIWAEVVCGVLRQIEKPFVLTLHGGNLPSFADSWPRRVHRLLGSAHAVVAPSGYLLHEMKDFRPDLRLIRNPLELAKHHFRPRTELKPDLIWVRAFHRIYDPALAIRVLDRVQRHYPDARLTMVGPDKGDSSFEAARSLAEQLGLADQVTFTGQVPKEAVPDWIAKADIMLNTATVDNAPVSVLEALASGLCVVSTDVGGLPYMLTHEETAILVPARDSDAMAEGVLRLLRNPDLALRLSQAGRREAERHRWEEVLPRWKRLFSEVAADAGIGSPK